jgi:WD40 repeat protein
MRLLKVVGIAMVAGASLLTVQAQPVSQAQRFSEWSAPAAGAQQFSGWSAPVSLGPAVNSTCSSATVMTCNEQGPFLSKDGLTLYFASNRPGGLGGLDIYVSERASVDDPWEPAQNLGPNINSIGDDTEIGMSTDGHLLFFHSARPSDSCGGTDLYFSHRRNRRNDFGWEPSQNLDHFGREPGGPLFCIVNAGADDRGPTYFEDEAGTTILYFFSNRAGVGDFDIYTTTRQPDGTWGFPDSVMELNTAQRDARTAIRRRDGLEVIFAREAGANRDLWVATRATTEDDWANIGLEATEPGGDVINTSFFEGSPALSWDGKTLFFFSDRPVAGLPVGVTARRDLYMSTRNKLKRRH